MSSYEKEFKEEVLYFNNTISLINKNLKIELNKVALAQKELMNVNRYMWENSAHNIDDIDRLADIKQDLSIIHIQKAGYEKIEKKIYIYKTMRKKPYFARIDFKEEDENSAEKIYIGFNNLLDEDTYDAYVYDWRSPIASIFYRCDTRRSKL